MFHFGLVEEIDPNKALVKVNLPDLEMVTHWLRLLFPVTQEDKEYQMPSVGTQVCVIMDPTATDGVVLGATYSDVDKPPVKDPKKWHKRFSDGTYLEYDKRSHTLTADVKGKVDLKATDKITVKGQQAVEAEGLTIKAKATTSAEVEALTIQLKSQVVNIDAPMTFVKNITVQGKIIPVPIP